MVIKDVHNNSEFEYISTLIMVIFELKIDEYMD